MLENQGLKPRFGKSCSNEGPTDVGPFQQRIEQMTLSCTSASQAKVNLDHCRRVVLLLYIAGNGSYRYPIAVMALSQGPGDR